MPIIPTIIEANRITHRRNETHLIRASCAGHLHCAIVHATRPRQQCPASHLWDAMCIRTWSSPVIYQASWAQCDMR